ncbi:MAG TPA: FtsX-like permease family protein [Bacteroidetes bacterium]|nr:FtsX-like permease family protein [Bacteroidota bacterium]
MQFLRESIVIAFTALWANKLRSALTILSVLISIMSIIAVVSILDGMDSYVKTKVASQGSNVFTINRFNLFEVFTDFDKFLESLKNPYLGLDDFEAIKREVTLGDYFDAEIEASGSLFAGRKAVENVAIRGRTEQYPAIGEFPIALGRHLSPIDIQKRSNVLVLGWDVARALFPDTDPIDKTVKLGGRHFRVIGVCEQKANILGNNQNLFAFMPVTTFLKQYGSRRQSLKIMVRTTDMAVFAPAQEQARTVMRIRHKLKPGDKDDFHIDTSEQLLSIWQGIATALFGTLVGVVSITLVVGGIIIMNVMLVAVTERTREIGIRKAIGARRSNIIMQFLIEAVLLTMAGGVIGILLGFGAANIVALLTPLPFKVAVWSVVVALTLTFLIGVGFGVYPAWKASRLDPVVALRSL